LQAAYPCGWGRPGQNDLPLEIDEFAAGVRCAPPLWWKLLYAHHAALILNGHDSGSARCN
jgi:hypothetical protein